MLLFRTFKRIPYQVLTFGNSSRFSKIKNFDLFSYQAKKKLEKVTSSAAIFKNLPQENETLTIKTALVYIEKTNQLVQKGKKIPFVDTLNFVKQKMNVLNFDNLTMKQIQSILIFLNNVQSKLDWSSKEIIKIQSTLASQVKILLNNEKLPTSEQSISLLIDLYLYLANDSDIINSKIIPLLFQQIQERNMKANNNVTNKSMLIYFKGYNKREITSSLEKEIRSMFLQKITETLQNIPISNLTTFCVELNSMDHFDLTVKDQQAVSIIFKQLESLVPQLELKQIRQIFSGEASKNNNITMFSVYKQILSFFFDSISAEGTSEIEEELILEIIKKSSKKINFKKHLTKEQETKFYAFLKHYINKYKKRESQINLFNSSLTRLIQDSFLRVDEQKENIDLLLKEISEKISIELLYTLDSNKYEIKDLLPTNKYNIQELGLLDVIRYSIILKKYSPQNDELYKLAYTSLEKNFQNITNFIKSVKDILRNDPNGNFLGLLTDCFPEFFSKLPNPFQVVPYNDLYTLAYLDFIYLGKHKPTNFILNFKKKNQKKISNERLSKLISLDINRKLNNYPLHSQIIKLLDKKMNAIFEEGDRERIKIIFIYLERWLRQFVKNGLDQNQSETLWQLLFTLINKKQSFKKINLYEQFVTFLHTFLCYYKSYQMKVNYKQLIELVFQNLNQYSHNVAFQTDIIKQCFRMNLVTKSNCSVISKTLKNKMNSLDLLKYRTLTDEQYLPDYNQNKEYFLELVVYNPRSQSIIEKYFGIILTQINNSSVSKLETLIINFNLPRSKLSLNLIKIILSTLIKQDIQFNSFDFLQIFQKINKNWKEMIEVRQLFQKSMKYFIQFPFAFSFLDHWVLCQLIKYTTQYNQQKIPLIKQFFKFVQSWLKSNASILNKSQVLVHLVDANFPFKEEHLNFILKMIEYQPKIAIKFFLYQEASYSDKSKKNIVKLIAEKINHKPDQYLNDWFYLYLKKKYPQEMKKVEVNVQTLSQFIFISKPIPSILQTLNHIAERLNLEFTPFDSFGKNQAYKFNQKIIFLVPPTKITSIITLGFMRKIIKEIQKIEHPIFFIENSLKDQTSTLFKCTLYADVEGNLLAGDQLEKLKELEEYSSKILTANKTKDSDENINE